MTNSKHIRLIGPTQREYAKAQIDQAPDGWTVDIKSPTKNRTAAQNALLHKWFGEIAAQRGDVTRDQVKGQCHKKYGLPIRLENEVFAYLWGKTGALLSYEKQCILLASGEFKISSGMNVKQLSEYMDPMSRDYREQGVMLTDPNMRGYEGME